MFTGLIEDIGTLRRFERQSQSVRLTIATTLPISEFKLGDSVACDGACLTVTELGKDDFSAELSHETVARTTWREARPGRKIHLERALRLGDRLGGHLVSGHVDGLGRIQSRRAQGSALDLTIQCDTELLRYIAVKGSIAVDGASLTVNAVSGSGFGLTLIPHTLSHTTLKDKREGDMVNLETDVLAKYVERLLDRKGGIDQSFLAEHGFLK